MQMTFSMCKGKRDHSEKCKNNSFRQRLLKQKSQQNQENMEIFKSFLNRNNTYKKTHTEFVYHVCFLVKHP